MLQGCVQKGLSWRGGKCLMTKDSVFSEHTMLAACVLFLANQAIGF